MEATFITWADEYAVGHKGLDAEHRHLVDAINEIYSAARIKQGPDQLRPLLETLKGLAQAHFKNENLVLTAMVRSPLPAGVERKSFIKLVSDAAIDKHIDDHIQTFSHLSTTIRSFYSKAESTEQLCWDLKVWFLGHAIKYDAHLREIFRALEGRAVP